jgi:D-arabinose 1-dehydrogenase-like Zn-dependent alcohol dehydrogenase
MSDTMRAVRFDASTRELAVREVPVPEPQPQEVVVRVDTCGICLSDVHLIDGSIPAVLPVVTPGHEVSGTIARTGQLVRGWSTGDRVVMMGGKPCLECARCRTGRLDQCMAPQLLGFAYDGGWAEYVTAPFFTLTPVPDGVLMEQAAILADAVATPYGAIKTRGALRPAERVGLWGIGGLGTHGVQLARMLGAGLILAVDPRASARDRALKLGADVAIDPASEDVWSAVMRATNGDGLDLAFDFVGANAVLQEAMSCLGRGGRAVMVGLSMDPIELGPGIVFGVRSNALLGHLGYSKQDLDELVELLARGRLDLSASISDAISLENVPDGVRRLATKEGDPVRIVVRP